MMLPKKTAINAFTLIELSIVVVIIGLIVGAVLVGRDLIRAAKVRSTISQIESYQSAVSTFYQKYEYLPGDIPKTPASNAGLGARGSYAGEGDGNGLIEGITADGAGNNLGYALSGGETAMAWVDLTTAGLINGGFSTATSTTSSTNVTTTSSPSIDAFMPQAKLGGGNYIYIWSAGGTGNSSSNFLAGNMFGLSVVSCLGCSESSGSNLILGSPGLTVNEAYNIDAKIDDGLPQSGSVAATFLWHRPSSCGASQCIVNGATGNAATAASSSTCYDNNNGVLPTQQYSVKTNSGQGVNCGLSFKVQAGEMN